ncbi:MAG TPA: carboxypeptidase-like regulatory domain-containing protein, partial [Planctomycetota bacterium]|nr:carboxypeptidase-like regulatory domain-containing protein [Planctomycetota bacterium]
LVTAKLDDVAQVELRDVPAGADDLVVTLATTGVSGKVVDAASGAPVERFRALASQAHVRTGPHLWSRRIYPEKAFASKEGAFTLAGLSAGRWIVSATAEGYVAATSEEVDVAAGAIATAIVRLQKAATLRGKVVDALDGTPVAGARVQHFAGDADSPGSQGMASEAESAGDGTFEIRGVRPGALRVVAMHERYGEAESALVTATAAAILDVEPIALARGGAIEGVARGEGARPMAGGQVWTWYAGGGARQPRVAGRAQMLAADGSFRIEGLVPGEYEVEARPASEGVDFLATEKKKIRANAVVEAGKTTRVEFPPVESGGCTVHGRVVRRGEPVANAFVWVVFARRDDGGELDGEWHAQTDGLGRFSIDHVPAGDAFLSAMAQSTTSSARSSFRRSIAVPSAPDLDVTLEAPVGGRITGRVTSRVDGHAIAGARVRADAIGADAVFAAAITDPDGAFAMVDVVPARYRVRAHPQDGTRKLAGGLAAQTKTAEVVEGGPPAVVDFALEVGARVVVETRNADGGPVSNGFVILHAKADDPDEDELTSTTNEGGFAVFDGVASGAYWAELQVEGSPAAHSEVVRVDSGETRVRVQLARAVPLRVRATGPDGAALAISAAWAIDAAGHEVAWGKSTDPKEGALLTVPSGTVTIGVRCEKLRGKQTVDVGEKAAEITVKVTEPDRKPG